MEQLRFIVISVTLLLCTANAFAQRHYENISALEINYGTNIFGDADNYTSLSFSKYINRKSYWKPEWGILRNQTNTPFPKTEVLSYLRAEHPLAKDTIKAWIFIWTEVITERWQAI